MNTFSNIKELVSTLKREEKLLSEMFSKRKTLSYKYEDALELVDFDEGKIQYLLERSVLRKNDIFLEIDDIYLNFFEHILEVNEEINISYINENIQNIKENINYYLTEKKENRKYTYLKQIKNTIRKIGITVLRNVIDLRRNIDTIYKNEPNYKIKKKKLENLDNKRIAIDELQMQTRSLIENDEYTFFAKAVDEELKKIIIELKSKLIEVSHNLVEIQKQIIDYLNQIKYQSGFIEKLRKVKYLKDQFILRTESNIDHLLTQNNLVIFESNPRYPVKLSLDLLITDSDVFNSIKRISRKIKIKSSFKPDLADDISDNYLSTETEEQYLIDLEEIVNSFMGTSYDLFDFVLNYKYPKNLDFDEIVTIYCQIISQFEDKLNITNEFKFTNNIEVTIVFPR